MQVDYKIMQNILFIIWNYDKKFLRFKFMQLLDKLVMTLNSLSTSIEKPPLSCNFSKFSKYLSSKSILPIQLKYRIGITTKASSFSNSILYRS